VARKPVDSDASCAALAVWITVGFLALAALVIFFPHILSGLRWLWSKVVGLFRRKPAAPGDPYAYVMAPVRRGPKGRSGAAVAEIEEESFRSFPPRR